MPKKKNKKDYTYAVGRRRSASARVRLFRGKGESTVNGKPADKYFVGSIIENKWKKPFMVIDEVDKYYFTAKVTGGGKQGQLNAVLLGVSRALSKLEEEKYRIPLKKAGLLTRDSRVRERRKVGTGGKARRKKQSPKR
ncbi:30S ribosomal protein S9 [Candidatus Woesebacteria bacterium]|nr:30S ribosomal protein S9 [Candidatus Woesebacteria bacterium]